MFSQQGITGDTFASFQISGIVIPSRTAQGKKVEKSICVSDPLGFSVAKCVVNVLASKIGNVRKIFNPPRKLGTKE